MHLHNGLGRLRRPHAQALQKLHAAQAQRQCACITGHVQPGGAGVKQCDVRVWHQPRRLQRQRQAHGACAHHGDAPGGGGGCGWGHLETFVLRNA
jgi:hypothetical protein